MMPIPGMDDLQYAWFEVKGRGFSLHGFLLYLSSDHHFPEYVNGEGLSDLDVWSGHDCAVYVIHTPSEKWIQYTQSSNHPWWQLFGHEHTENSDLEVLREFGDAQLLIVNGEAKTMREVFDPSLNEFHHNGEIAKVLHRFGLRPTETPCLIFFKDLYDNSIWSVDLKEFAGVEQRVLRAAMQAWFGGKDFARLLKEVRHA
ncbi:hypothetical protein [Planctomicrobium sp. SH527]|uniref:hypothetical protein n=1 Tax=Planctomicrobium sp. SH527 TaxID=3448123 RepID=UPI003F5B6863